MVNSNSFVQEKIQSNILSIIQTMESLQDRLQQATFALTSLETIAKQPKQAKQAKQLAQPSSEVPSKEMIETIKVIETTLKDANTLRKQSKQLSMQYDRIKKQNQILKECKP